MWRILERSWRVVLALWLVGALAVMPGVVLVVAAAERVTNMLLLTVAIVGALAGVAIAGITIRQIDRRLSQILSRIELLAGGDYRSRPGSDSEGGTLARMMGALDELAGILEQRAAETAAERRYRALYEHSPAALFRTRLDGRILDCNMTAVRMLGYDSVTDATTRDAVAYYADAADRDDVLARLANYELLRALPLRFRRKDGSDLHGLLTAVRTDERGESFVDGMIFDATLARP